MLLRGNGENAARGLGNRQLQLENSKCNCSCVVAATTASDFSTLSQSSSVLVTCLPHPLPFLCTFA